MAINLPKQIKDLYFDYQTSINEKNRIADIVQKFSPARSLAIRGCGNTQIIKYNEKLHRHKVVFGEYCNDRLCPLCQQALHRERSSKLSYMVSRLSERDYKFYFWTFSPAPNCKLEYLNDTSRAVINVFNRVRKQFFNENSGCVGFWRTLEFTKHTHNKNNIKDMIDDDAEFHPHIHALFVVDSSFVTPNVFDVSSFIKSEVEKQLKSKDARYKFYKFLKGTAGIVNVKPVNTRNAGFSFELCKYISLSKISLTAI